VNNQDIYIYIMEPVLSLAWVVEVVWHIYCLCCYIYYLKQHNNMYVTVHRFVLYSIWFHTDVCKKARNTKWFALITQIKWT